MKLLRVERQKLVFHLDSAEQRLFLAVLDRYPVVPSAHQSLSKTGSDDSSQRLLDEALAEQRRENRKLLAALLKNPRRFLKMKSGWRLTLSAPDIEWLLQILNDIRVGSWILLGSPDEDWHVQLDDSAGAQVWAMELAGYFQLRLLEALREAGEELTRKKPPAE